LYLSLLFLSQSLNLCDIHKIMHIALFLLCFVIWLCSVRLISDLELGVVCICGFSAVSSTSGIEDNFRKAVYIGAVLTVICITRSHYAVVLNIIVPWLRQSVTDLPLQKS